MSKDPKKKKGKKGVFGIPLDQVILSNDSDNENVPDVITQIVTYLEKNGN